MFCISFCDQVQGKTDFLYPLRWSSRVPGGCVHLVAQRLWTRGPLGVVVRLSVHADREGKFVRKGPTGCGLRRVCSALAAGGPGSLGSSASPAPGANGQGGLEAPGLRVGFPCLNRGRAPHPEVRAPASGSDTALRPSPSPLRPSLSLLGILSFFS